MQQRFVFPLPPSLNRMLGAANANRHVGAAMKKRWTATCQSIALGGRRFPGEVYLSVTILYKRAIDPDNLFASLKPILDGMQKAEIIKNDGPKIIRPPIVYRYGKAAPKREGKAIVVVSDVPLHHILEKNPDPDMDGAELARYLEALAAALSFKNEALKTASLFELGEAVSALGYDRVARAGAKAVRPQVWEAVAPTLEALFS